MVMAVLIGAFVLIVGLYLGEKAWLRWRWEQLASSLQMKLAPELRTASMRIDPIIGEVYGRPTTILMEVDERGQQVTLIMVEMEAPLGMGLLVRSESWQARAERTYEVAMRLTHPMGWARLAYDAVSGSRDDRVSVELEHERLRKLYVASALDPTKATRVLAADGIAEAFLDARRPRWSVHVDDRCVAITPGLGSVTSLRTVRRALGLAGRLGTALVEAAG